MRVFYHHARKVRQLKNRLKLLKITSRKSNEKLLNQVKRLILSIPTRYIPKSALIAFGIIVTNSQIVNAQPITFQQTNEIVYPSRMLLGTPSPWLFVPPPIPFQSRFVDVDNDGDLDAFYATYHIPDTFSFYPPHENYIYFQENISTENLGFSDSKKIIDNAEYGILFSFNVANFDNDGDYDIYQFMNDKLSIFVNGSDASNLFTFTDTLTFQLYDDAISNYYQLLNPIEFIDVNNDSQLDLVSAYINNNQELKIYYLQHTGNNETFPFDTTKHDETFGITEAINSLGLDFLNYERFQFDHLFNFTDLDQDGDKDLVVQGIYDNSGNITLPSYCQEIDSIAYHKYRLYYFKNVSSTNTPQFESTEELITEKDKITIDPHCNYNTYSASIFMPLDIDNDGDIDILEPNGLYYQDPSYSSAFPYLTGFNFYENITNENQQLSGTVYIDENSNGVIDTIDIKIESHPVFLESNSNNKIRLTDSDGQYKFLSSEGQRKIFTNISADIWVIEPNEYILNLGTAPAIIDSLDFRLRPNGEQLDLNVFLSTTPAARGFLTRYFLTVKNEGNLASNGTIQFKHDENLEYRTSFPPANIVTDTMLTWEIDTLDVFQHEKIQVDFKVSLDTELGDTLFSEAFVDPLNNDINPSGNYILFEDVVVGSYDPNDKLVNPDNNDNNGATLPSDNLFTYTIRFQNTGTAPARIVSIIDTIDNDLNLSTFKMISSSHDYTLTIENHVARWEFPNIQLPDSSMDLEGSNGYIQYFIAPKSSIEGTEFTNRAHIYFDFNEAITTNETFNVIRLILGLNQPKNLSFNLFPNPTAEKAILQFENPNQEKAHLELYDLNGKLVLQEEVYDQQIILFKNQLSKGIYTFSLKVGNEIGSGKVVFE